MNCEEDNILTQYDLSKTKGVRGKYAKAYKAGHSVKIYDGDKLVSEEHFAAIEPDVHSYFPDSKSINKALRTLISIIPNKAHSVQK